MKIVIMKYSAFVLALAALALASCERNQMETISEEESCSMTIHASVEGASGKSQPSTRTTVVDGGTQVYWEPGDEIKVFFNGASGRFVSQNTENATVTDFSGTINLSAGAGMGSGSGNPIWGLYPYRADATCDGASVTTTLPASQTARAGSFAQHTHITLAKSEGLDLSFYNVCGGLRFSLTQEGIKRITFKGRNGERLAGRVKLNFLNDVPAIQEYIDTEPALELTAPDGGTFQTGQWYYFEVLPVNLPSGFKMVFYKESKSAVFTYYNNAVTISRGVYGSLENVDKDLVFQPEAVDLGLSVKWASTNVGATTPEEYGNYFAWGETEPKFDYSWETYKWITGSQLTFTKYNTRSDYGTIDNKTTLDLEDDAARANKGGTWRMPTDAEWTELRNNCTWTWTNQNSINGYLVSASNGNSIFLPAAGARSGTSLSRVGSHISYWSSSLDTDTPTFARCSLNSGQSRASRFNGYSVRPVTK